MYHRYPLGNLIQVQGVFRDANSNLYDPPVVKISYRTPDGTLTTLVYGTDAEVLKASTGTYTLQIHGNQVGTWYYRWFCDHATVKAADEEKFYVENAIAN